MPRFASLIRSGRAEVPALSRWVIEGGQALQAQWPAVVTVAVLLPSYWKQKFLYPFALDQAPLRFDADSQMKPIDVIREKKRLNMMSDESLMETKKF